MKISTIAFLAAVGTSSAFTTAPSAGRSSRAVASSTELFGRRRAGSTKRATGKKVANPKFGTAEHTDITEDQVRSLFSLWNNALATGDSVSFSLKGIVVDSQTVALTPSLSPCHDHVYRSVLSQSVTLSNPFSFRPLATLQELILIRSRTTSTHSSLSSRRDR